MKGGRWPEGGRICHVPCRSCMRTHRAGGELVYSTTSPHTIADCPALLLSQAGRETARVKVRREGTGSSEGAKRSLNPSKERRGGFLERSCCMPNYSCPSLPLAEGGQRLRKRSKLCKTLYHLPISSHTPQPIFSALQLLPPAPNHCGVPHPKLSLAGG